MIQKLASLPSLLSSGLRFLQTHGLKASFSAFMSKEAHPLLQFMKYGMCGALTLVVQTVLYMVFSKLWFPNYTGIEGLSDETAAWNFAKANLLAFPFANICAYGTNRLWVFTGGRHHWVREFILFTVIAFASFLPGIALGWFARSSGSTSVFAQITFVITSALVNFVCRKFFVFKK